MGSLAVVLVIVLAVALGAVAALALRNRVFLRLGARTVSRRPARTALIVLGLMLGTAIISSALSTGDTMSNTIRSSVIDSLGQTDEVVRAKGADTENVVALGEATGVRYFDESVTAAVETALAGSALVDGIAPAIIEPAEQLGAAAEDRIQVFAAGLSSAFRVRAIVRYEGAGTDGPALLLPLLQAQRLLGHVREIKYVLVSNAGDALSGAGHSDAVVAALEPALAPFGLEADPAKQDGLDLADLQGNVFMSFFTTFGTFSIAAGILLIFLIFVMLATERRAEMGIARAVGTRRGPLVQMFLFEGVVYDLAAAAVGALLGIGVAYGMVLLLARALGSMGLEIRHDLSARSLVVAYALGVLVTFLVVTLSAWRVSVLNIVTAIRNLPEPPRLRTRRFRFAWAGGGLVLGALLTVAGVAGEQMTPFMLGVSIALVSLVPLVRALGLPERAAYTIAGFALVVWWLLPVDTFESLIPGLGMDFTVWIVGGLMVVVGATWLLVYNADALLGALMAVLGRVRSLAPVLKLAAAYPLRSRFRTGTTLAMFTLVVYTLVVGGTTSNAFMRAFNDEQVFGGGFDVRADIAASNPVPDMTGAIARAPGLNPANFEVVASQSFLPIEAKQEGPGDFEDYLVRGLDGEFLTHTTFGLAMTARGYDSAEQVWNALAATPGLAVVDSLVVPRLANWNFGPPPSFRLSGFYLEDETFAPVPIVVRDPQTGRSLDLTVIGVLSDSAPPGMLGISTSQQTLAPFGDRVQPTVYYFGLAPGADPEETATALESAFLTNGMEADSISDILEEAVGASLTFQ